MQEQQRKPKGDVERAAAAASSSSASHACDESPFASPLSRNRTRDGAGQSRRRLLASVLAAAAAAVLCIAAAAQHPDAAASWTRSAASASVMVAIAPGRLLLDLATALRSDGTVHAGTAASPVPPSFAGAAALDGMDSAAETASDSRARALATTAAQLRDALIADAKAKYDAYVGSLDASLQALKASGVKTGSAQYKAAKDAVGASKAAAKAQRDAYVALVRSMYAAGTLQLLSPFAIPSATPVPTATSAATPTAAATTATTHTPAPATSAPVPSAAAPSPNAPAPVQVVTACTVPGHIAITYDDGPFTFTQTLLNAYTGQMSGGAPAKFTVFQNGANWDCIHNYADLVRAIDAGGHQIGSHTWEHPDLLTLSTAQIVYQMTRLDYAFQQILGKAPLYMRPPYGNYDDSVLAVLSGMGYKAAVMWNQDSFDYAHPSDMTSSETMYTGLSDTQAAVVLSLQHDVHEKTVTDLTPWIISWAQARNLTMVTVGECLGDTNPASWYRQVAVPATVGANCEP